MWSWQSPNSSLETISPVPDAITRAPSTIFQAAGRPRRPFQCDRSVPSNKTMASDGGRPGFVLGTRRAWSHDGRQRPVAVVDMPLAAGQHRRVLEADLRADPAQ